MTFIFLDVYACAAFMEDGKKRQISLGQRMLMGPTDDPESCQKTLVPWPILQAMQGLMRSPNTGRVFQVRNIPNLIIALLIPFLLCI